MRLKWFILFGLFAVLGGLFTPLHAATRVVMCEEYYWSG
jgi:hypothetical protein